MNKRRTISQRSELIYDIHNFGISADTRELFINPDYSVDNDSAEVDYRMASTLIKNVRFLNNLNHNNIIIHMCSCGGVWEYGLAMYDAIKASQSVVYIIAYAHARSMSSIILQAGDYRILSPNTYVMIHEGSDGYEGSSHGLSAHVEQAKNAAKLMLDIYIEQCKHGSYFKKLQMTDLRIRNFIVKKMREKQEWYLSASEAIEYGFADYILGDDKCPTIEDIINPA